MPVLARASLAAALRGKRREERIRPGRDHGADLHQREPVPASLGWTSRRRSPSASCQRVRKRNTAGR